VRVAARKSRVVILVMRATILFVSLYLGQEVMNAMKRKVYN
jgi:hypothetical protein